MANKAVEIKNLSYTYPDGTEALRDISLEILAGESVGIIGPNGAGKTTLLLHLNGILKGSGFVKIMDFKINGKNSAEIRKEVGLVFQDPENQLFMPTVSDDVSFGPANMGLPPRQIRACVDEALKEVGMLDALERPSHHLSFGEKKRVSIATVLSMKPQILVLDEPTSNLDPKGRRNIIELLKDIAKTKIIASHDLEMISHVCSRYLFLDKGRIVKSDSTQQGLAELFSE